LRIAAAGAHRRNVAGNVSGTLRQPQGEPETFPEPVDAEDTMDPAIRRAIEGGLTCDITTFGRKSGEPRRLEIWYFVVEGRVYITGTPGQRDWYANLGVNPRMIFHVKQGALADLPAHAALITGPAERRRIMAAVMGQNSWFAAQSFSLDDWVVGSPLIEVIFD
jgi:deazaflavin-dependent oxidoreductase (nitroreductase family)